jgi:hypothetical protein
VASNRQNEWPFTSRSFRGIVADLRHIAEIDGPARRSAYDYLAHAFRTSQEVSGLNVILLVAGSKSTNLQALVGALERAHNTRRRDAVTCHEGGIN